MSCLEGHFLGIRRGVEQHYEEVTFFYIYDKNALENVHSSGYVSRSICGTSWESAALQAWWSWSVVGRAPRWNRRRTCRSSLGSRYSTNRCRYVATESASLVLPPCEYRWAYQLPSMSTWKCPFPWGSLSNAWFHPCARPPKSIFRKAPRSVPPFCGADDRDPQHTQHAYPERKRETTLHL